jgi:folate-binding protein YgfZ
MMRILQVTGKEAGDFLHRVTSGTVKGLATGEGAGGLLLNGQSRIRAQFDLLRDESGYWLAVPEAGAEVLAEGLEALHFAEELEIRLTEWRVGARSAGGGKRPAKFSFREKAWPAAVPGYHHYFTESEEPWPADYEFDRIGALVPSPLDWTPDTPALEAGLLDWIDRYKGCYPGQEVVERSLNVGHPARVLVGFEGPAPLRAGEKVSLDGGGEGLITSVAEREGKFRALARVPWNKREAVPAGFRALGKDLH